MIIQRLKFFSLLLIVFSLVLGACVSRNLPSHTPLDQSSPVEATQPSVWSSLLDVTPLPYASPLPDFEVTPLDGVYVKFDPNPPQWWACLRCADYRQAGGIWRLQFDRGVMRIYYEVTGWVSLASYQVSDDHLLLFNDPHCKDATGEYQWELQDGALHLEAVNDPCSFELRGKNLSQYSWEVCPRDESGDVEEPRGCSDPVPPSVAEPVLPEGLSVNVREADVRLDANTPDVILIANGIDLSLPEGARISYGEESMPYGVNRVLWQKNDWMEMTFSEPFTSAGVQFLGSYVNGWARVLFDGQEIWSGNTAEIWSEEKVHGGYIEIMGFELGEHVIRVERMDVDSRPVMVAFFGLGK